MAGPAGAARLQHSNNIVSPARRAPLSLRLQRHPQASLNRVILLVECKDSSKGCLGRPVYFLEAAA
jgi:hypothetical protein